MSNSKRQTVTLRAGGATVRKVKCSACGALMRRAEWDTHRCLRSMTDAELAAHIAQRTTK